MRFEVGDKVRVKNNLKHKDTYDGIVFITGMEEYCGKTLTILNVVEAKNGMIYYNTEENIWWWSESMFEPIDKENEMNKIPELETGMFVIIKNTDFGKEYIGVIVGDKIIYNDGDFDYVKNAENCKCRRIEYILKCPYGFKHISYHLRKIKSNTLEFNDNITVLWKYEEPIPKVTLNEVYKKFGHKVKIIDNE